MPDNFLGLGYSDNQLSKNPYENDANRGIVDNSIPFLGLGTGDKSAPEDIANAFPNKRFDEDYDQYITSSDLSNISEERALMQPWTDQALRSVGQLSNEIVFGTVQGLAALGDLESYEALLNNSSKSDQDFHNAVYDWAKGIKESINEEIPIYSGDRFDSGWFWKNLGQTIGSAGSFFIPGIGVAKGLSSLGKGLKLNTTASGLLETLGGAAAMRHAENFQEASSMYDMTYKAALDKFTSDGLSFDEAQDKASSIAGEAAASNYKMNASNYFFDVLQLGAILKPKLPSFLKGFERQPYQVLKQANLLPESKLGRFGQWVADPAKGILSAGSEGLEEVVNQVSQYEAQRDADIKMGKIQDDGSTFFDRLPKYLGEAETIDSFMWGAIGGAAFKGLGLITGQDQNKQITRNKLGELAGRSETLKAYSEQVNTILGSQLSDSGKQAAIESLNKDLSFNLGLNAARVGNTDILLKQLDQPEFQEQLINSGIATKDEIDSKIPEIKRQVELADYLYNKHNNRLYESPIDSTIKARLIEQSVSLEKQIADNNEDLTELNKQYNDIRTKDPIIKSKTYDPEYNNSINIGAIKFAKVQLQNQLESTKDESVKQDIQKVLAKLDIKEQNLAGADVDVSTFSNMNIITNLAQQEILKEFNNVINDKINNITSDDNVKEVKTQVNKEKKEAQEFVKNNKDSAESKVKQDRVNQTEQQLLAKQISQVANKIVNRKSAEEQLTPEEQQIYDNNTEAVEQAIVDLQNYYAEQASQEDIPDNPFGDIFEPTPEEIKEFSTEKSTGYSDPTYYDNKKDFEIDKTIDKLNENLRNDQGSKTVDVNGNIVIEGNKISDGYQALGYLSREYELVKGDKGKKFYQDVNNELIDKMDKFILSTKQFNPGDEVELFVNEDYDGEFYDPSIKDDNKAVISWKSYLDSLKAKYGENYKSSDEYIQNVPIGIRYKGQDLNSTYYHQNSWINENKVTGDIEKDKKNNYDIRKYIIENNGYITKITYKGNGPLFKMKEYIPLNQATEDPDPILAVVDKDQSFKVAKGSAEASYFQDQTINTKDINPGTTVLLAEVNQGKYLALPVKNLKISQSLYKDQIKGSITTAIEIFLKNDRTNQFALDVLKTMKLDITSIEGLEGYITRFINNYNTNKQNLYDLQKSGALPVDTNTTIFSINKGNIAFKHKGNVYYTSKALANKSKPFFDKLSEALDNIYTGTNIEALSKNENLQFANQELISYKTFLHNNLTSNIKGFKVDEQNGEPFYSYTIQKVVRLDFSNIIENNEPLIDEQSMTDISPNNIGENVSKSDEPEFFKVFDLDQFSELPALSQEQNELLRKSSERLIIPGLNPQKQEAVVDSLVNSIITKVFNGEKVKPNEVYKEWKDKLEKYRDQIRTWINDEKNKSHSKYNNSERLYNSLEAILNSWSTVTKFADQKWANINNLKQTYDSTLDEQEIQDSERKDFDKNIIQNDPAQGLSAKVKTLLAGIQDIDKNGNPKKNWLGEPEMVDYRVVYTTFQQWTTDLLRPDFNDMLAAIKVHEDEFNWVPNAIKKLESIPDQDRKAFVNDLLNHYKRLIKVMFDDKDNKGGFVNNIQSPSKLSSAGTLSDKWEANFINSPLVTLLEGEYVFNNEKCKEVVAEFKSFDKNVTVDQIKQWLSNFNIQLTNKTWNALAKGYYRVGSKKLSLYELTTNSYSPFVVLNNSIDKLAKNRSVEDSNPFDNTAVKGLANFAARYTDNLYSQMVRTAGKMIYPFNKNTYVSNRILDLTKGNLIEKLKTLPFNKHSYWLSDNVVNLFKGNLELAVADMEVLKKHGDRRTGDNELQNLPESDYEMVKLGLLHASQEDKTGSKARIISLLYPTQSDKTTSIIANGIPAFEIGYNIDGTIDEDTLNRIYDQLVLPEIERIKHFQKLVDAKVPINISGLVKGWNMFYFIPSLNEVEGVFIDGRLNPDIQVDEVINKRIKDKLQDTITQLANDKLERWNNYGLIVKGEPTYFDNRFIKESKNLKGIQKTNPESVNRALATDAVVQYLVGNANMFMTMIYDPANAYKGKAKDNIIKQLKDTYINIGKRLAADIAPGSETEANKEGTYKQAFVSDKAVDSKNLKQLTDLLKDKSKDYSKEGDILKEGTNAQEFVTVSEQFARYYHEGKIPEDMYLSIASTIKNEVLKGNYYYTQKVIDNLNKINSEYAKLFQDQVLQVEKPVYVDNKIDETLQHEVRYYIKTSAYTLTPELTANKDIDNIRIAMEKQGIDRLAFSSGIKLGNFTNPTKLWNDDGTIKSYEEIDFSKSSVQLNRSGFRIQQLVPYDEDKAAINRVSQASKNLFLNLHQVNGFEYQGKTYKGEELEKIYQDLYKQVFDIQKNDFANEISYDLTNKRFINTEESISKIKKMLLEEAVSRDYPISDIESIQLDDTLKFLAFSPSSQRFESLLNSLVQNRVLKIMFPGKSFVLSTEEGYQTKITQEDVKQKSGIIYTSNYNPEKGLLPQRIENGVVKPAQAIVPFKFRDNSGNLLNIEDFIGENGMIDSNKLSQDLLQLFGMRIPNQGLNSQSWIEIVGFMPHNAGDVIVATRDYLVQMGSDFDVDKLYTYMYSTYYNEKSGKLKRFKAKPQEKQNVFDKEIIKSEDKKKELINNILDVHIAIHKNSANEVQKQIFEPLGTWEFEDIAKKIEASQTSKTDFVGISDQYQQDVRLNNATDKALVGIYSNLSMFNAVAQNKELKLMTGPEQSFVLQFGTKKSNGDLSGEYTIGDNKTYRSTVISGLQSCAVDGAKLQVLGKFNHNMNTSKYVNLLAQLGFKEEVALFTAQPIIKRLIKEVNDSKSVLKPFESDVLNKTIVKLKSEVKGKIENFDKNLYDEKYSGGKGLSIDNMWSTIKNRESNPEYQYIQLAALDQFEFLTPYAKTVSAVMSAINTDSKGLDKNLLETLNKYDNVLKNVKNGNINIQNVERLLQNNINGSATEILEMNNNIWQNILPYQTTGVQNYFNYILNILGKQDASITKKAEIQKEIFDEFKSYLYTRTELGLTDSDVYSERRRLFFGDTNLAQLISKLQEQEVWKNHPFIGKLYFEINKNGLPSVVKINAAQEDIVEKSTIMGAYDLLLNDKPIEGTEYTTRTLMQDLVLAAYLSGGIQQATQYLKYIPPAYLHTIPFAERLTQMIDKFNDDGFMQIPGINAYNWELPSFIVQYFQHNSDRIKKIPTDDKGNPIGIQRLETKDKILEKFVYNLSEGEDTPIFLAINAGKRKKGLSKNYIYIHQGEILNGNPVYTRIDNLGYSGFKEYNGNISSGVFAKSVIVDNNSNNTVNRLQSVNEDKEVSRTLVDPELTKPAFEKLGIKSGGIEVIDEILENIIFEDTIDPYYKTVASALRTNLDRFNNLKITTRTDISARGKYYNGDSININPKNNESSSINDLSKVILHELIHANINPALEKFLSGNKNFTKEQLIALTRINNVWIKYSEIIKNKESKDYQRFKEAYEKYKLEKKDNPLAKIHNVTEAEIGKFYPTEDVREFVTMALTDEGFQKILNDIPFDDNQTWLEKIFTEITNLLGKLLGIDIKKGNALDIALHDVMSLLSNVNNYTEIKNINQTDYIKKKQVKLNVEFINEIKYPVANIEKIIEIFSKKGALPTYEQAEKFAEIFERGSGAEYHILESNNITLAQYEWIKKNKEIFENLSISLYDDPSAEGKNFVEYLEYKLNSQNVYSFEDRRQLSLFDQESELPKLSSWKLEFLKKYNEVNPDGTAKTLRVTDTTYRLMLDRAKKINNSQNLVKASVAETVGEGKNSKERYYYIRIEERNNVSLWDRMQYISDQEIQNRIKACK